MRGMAARPCLVTWKICAMKTGVIFDIQEFMVHDGPGLRTSVFLKGCPLRCQWCHNPEGLSPEPQIMHGPAGDRLAGQKYTSEELARRLNQQAEVLRAGGGGVTFSGGEPLQQAEFLAEVIRQLERTHVLLETSGFAAEDALRLVAGQCDLVYFDLKLIDSALHRRFTGVDNARILESLRVLDSLRTPYVIRVPLVPGVTDTSENLAAIARTALSLTRRPRVELLPYNRAAGGKYASCGLEFRPEYDERQAGHPDLTPFQSLGLTAVLIS